MTHRSKHGRRLGVADECGWADILLNQQGSHTGTSQRFLDSFKMPPAPHGHIITRLPGLAQQCVHCTIWTVSAVPFLQKSLSPQVKLPRGPGPPNDISWENTACAQGLVKVNKMLQQHSQVTRRARAGNLIVLHWKSQWSNSSYFGDIFHKSHFYLWITARCYY